MFTGLIQQIGRVSGRRESGGDLRLEVGADPGWCAHIARGDSIAVNGVCLTVTGPAPDGFSVDVSRATLACTTLGRLTEGARLNLEKALRAGDPLGGHLVSGHVDAVSRVSALERDGRSWRLRIELPRQLAHLVARKGSICIDGASLTVNEVEAGHFGVNIVPHTMAMTIIGEYLPDTVVNLEADIIARYVARVLGQRHNEGAD